MGKKGCCVMSCKPTITASRHRFPNPDEFPQLFRTWLRLTGNKVLANMCTPHEIFYRHFICGSHFKKEDYLKRKLKKYTIPTLFLPEYEIILGKFVFVLVNNFLARHSIGANCEDDGGSLLYTIQNYFEENYCPEIIPEVNVNVDEHIPQDTLSRFHKGALGYVAGYLIKMKSEINGSCEACRQNLLTRDSEDMESDYNTFSRSLEYGGKKKFRLQYCNREFIDNVVSCYSIIKYVVRKYVDQHVFNFCCRYLEQIDWNFIPCEYSENVKKNIVKHFVFLNVHTFCKGINRVINGQDTRQIRSNHLDILKQAHEICRIRRLWRK